MKASFRLQTTRLDLRAPLASDAEAVFERYARDGEVTRYFSWPRHLSLDDTRGFLTFSAAQWTDDEVGPYLIRSRDDGRLLGGTGLAIDREPGSPGDAMTGYVLAKDAWGQGVATEALGAMVTLAQIIGVRRIYALCHPQHRASSHVLEKCGFWRVEPWTRQIVFPNLAPGVPQDVLCYVRAAATPIRESPMP